MDNDVIEEVRKYQNTSIWDILSVQLKTQSFRDKNSDLPKNSMVLFCKIQRNIPRQDLLFEAQKCLGNV